MIDVILVDDDANVLDGYREVLELEGLEVAAHASVAAAVSIIRADTEAVIVSDVRMPGHDGFDLIALMRGIDPDIPIVLMSGHGDIPPGEQGEIIASFLTFDKPFPLVLGEGRTIIEVRSNAMPDRGIVATFTDITQRVAADRALKQANETLEQRVAERTAELTRVNHALAEARASADEANIGKTRFFAAAGHDILQPLNAARLYSSALVERLGQAENNAALVRNIDSALESVETILGAVLDISRLDTGAMKPRLASVPLSDLLSRIETDFAPIAREKKLKLVIMPTSLSVRSDPALLRRLIQNLVSNAIKYTISGKVLVGARRRGGKVVIQVMDSGIGIPSSKFRTIFKEFARLDEGARTASGLGLGLSIVDRIARVLNHGVEVRSQLGRGTDFRVTLPLDRAIPAASPAAAPLLPDTALPTLAGLNVLCIDNEERILEGMRVLISGWGCRVETATSLEKALARVATPARIDLVIADYHLDKGTGIEAILALRREVRADLPALLLTADRSQEVRAEAERNAIALQNKPARPAALRAYLTQMAGLRSAAAE